MYATFLNYFNYGFFLVVFLSGLYSWYFEDPTFAEYREYWKSLVTLHVPVVEAASAVHILLFALFLIYLPYTKSMHYISRFLAFFRIRWDDEPNVRGGRMEKELQKLLSPEGDLGCAAHPERVDLGKRGNRGPGVGKWRGEEVKKTFAIKDFADASRQVVDLTPQDLVPLPPPYDKVEAEPPWRQLTEEQKARYETTLDGVCGIGVPRPQTKEEEEAFVRKFLSGLEKLFSKEDNWTFLQPLMHSLDYCVKCQICSDACPAYVSSGRKEIYRPTFRPEVLRRIIGKYLKKEGRLKRFLHSGDIELNWTLVARLAELAYRCTLCRRCAQVCPIGIDNALITREIRKVFSQELGIAPRELHESGTVQQLRVGSSTGITPKALEQHHRLHGGRARGEDG